MTMAKIPEHLLIQVALAVQEDAEALFRFAHYFDVTPEELADQITEFDDEENEENEISETAIN